LNEAELTERNKSVFGILVGTSFGESDGEEVDDSDELNKENEKRQYYPGDLVELVARR